MREAIKRCESQLNFSTIFYVMQAQEEKQKYQLFLQIREQDSLSSTIIEQLLDYELKHLNMEYKCKRDSGRLAQASITFLQPGCFDHFKKHLLNQGNRESQLKFMTLVYARDNTFAFEDYCQRQLTEITLLNLKEA